MTLMSAFEKDYRLLGLTPAAPPEEVRRAYIRLVKRCHPDKMQDRPLEEQRLAEEALKEITSAYRRITSAWIYREKLRKPPDLRNARFEQESQYNSFRWFTGKYSPFSPYQWNRRFLAFVSVILVLVIAFMSIPTSRILLSHWKTMQQADTSLRDGLRPPSAGPLPREHSRGE